MNSQLVGILASSLLGGVLAASFGPLISYKLARRTDLGERRHEAYFDIYVKLLEMELAIEKGCYDPLLLISDVLVSDITPTEARMRLYGSKKVLSEAQACISTFQRYQYSMSMRKPFLGYDENGIVQYSRHPHQSVENDSEWMQMMSTGNHRLHGDFKDQLARFQSQVKKDLC